MAGTTRGLPAGADYERFCDDIAPVYLGVRPERPAGMFPADYALFDLGPFALGAISTPGTSAHRDRRSIARLPDDALFINHSVGPWGLRQHGQEWRGVPHSALVLDNDRPFTVVAEPARRLRLHSLRVPRELLSGRTRDRLTTLDDRLAASPAGAQLGTQMALLARSARDGSRGVATAMAHAVVEMLDAFASASSTPPARADAMRAYAMMRLGDPSLDVGRVAAAFACSPRTVQVVFAREGVTFAQWLRAERLDAARALLRSGEHPPRTVAAVARDVGFGDVGTFHRAYRARFGLTPAADR